MAELHVELVSVERQIWSGEAEQVSARTTEGEIGILHGHATLLGQLAEGFTVTVRRAGGDDLTAAVHGGFLSVTDEGVTILAERAELSTEIDAGRAQEALQRARAADDDAGVLRAESRLRAVGQPV
ncbi:MAG: F0F1 ATP synthase subunit epsilon [Mycobacteriales bacterium]